MTYCCGILVRDGLVMIADTRTNAGLDNISVFRKLHVFSVPGERIIAIASAGNLSLTQSVLSMLHEGLENPETGERETLIDAPTMFQAAQRLGRAIRALHRMEGAALEAADAVLLFRTATKQVCARHGYHASFMSRPGIPGFFSSGWHLHLSACDARSGENVFVSEDPSSILSETGVQFAAGILEHACESTVFTTPTINGYKRFRPNALAPDRVNWGADQRGALLRICGTYGDPATHLENRAGEPAANPYLYVASQIVAGLDGIRRELTPPEQTDRPYETDATLLPASLSAAIEELDNSEFFRDALGSELVDFLLVHKRSEVARWSAAGGVEPTASEESGEEPVSEWEQREYFDLF